MGINGGRGIRSGGAVLGGSGISLSGGGTPPFSFGNALQFDGVNDYVSISSISMTANRTLSFWVKFNNTGNFEIFGKGSFNYSLATNINSTKIGSITLGFPNAVSIVDTYNPADWHMITIIINSDSLTSVYIDANAIVENQSFTILPIVRIGGANYGAIDAFNGVLDEIAIWDSALTQEQITNLYSSGSGDLATNYSPDDLIAYWRCNESDGATTLVDETGNYNGTLNNFSTPPAYFIPH